VDGTRQAVSAPIDARLPLRGTGGLGLALLAPLPFFDRHLFKSSANRASRALSNFQTSWFASLPR
jgi:hypothetical protein